MLRPLTDVTLEIDKGEFVFLTGPSGAGKTTFLKLIFREETPTSGQILVNGRNVSAIPEAKIPYLRRDIGVVFQDFKLLRRKTVFENVAFVLRVMGVETVERKRRAFQILKQVGLHHRMHSYPLQLSGGEQQRVAVARAPSSTSRFSSSPTSPRETSTPISPTRSCRSSRRSTPAAPRSWSRPTIESSSRGWANG
jgi:ABC-type ATPase involved in cell division